MYVKMMVCLFIFSAFSLLNITGVLAEEDVLSVLDFEDYFYYEDGNYVLTSDIVVDSSFRIDGHTVVLNGYSMTVEGNLCIDNGSLDLGSGSLTVNGDFYINGFDTSNPAVLDINNGNLIIEGNFDTYDNVILYMVQENDYVLVHKDFYFNSFIPHGDYLINGTLEVKGDFYDFSKGNFLPSQNHRVVLSGEDVQYVTFEYPELSSFNILELTKPLETGYVFSHTPVWNTLIEPGTSFKPGDLDGNGTVDSTDATILKRYIVSIIDEIPAGNDAADLNGDGDIDSLDYTLLNRFILGMITEFPVNR